MRGLFRSTIVLLAFALFAVALPVYSLKVAHKSDYMDFDVYYRAALRAKAHDWGNIYTLADGASPMRYAPPFLLLLRPFAELSSYEARQLWFYLQAAWFGLGFFFVYLCLRQLSSVRREGRALFITAFSALFVLRFCLDCFMIGQVSSLIFLLFAVALYGWLRRRSALTGGALLLPTLLKIGPGILYGLCLARTRRVRRGLSSPLILFVALSLACLLWLGLPTGLETGWPTFRGLWGAWVTIVAQDSYYYDSAHYGTQSINSFLLRLARDGVFSSGFAANAHLLVTVLGSGALFGFWCLRRPRDHRGRGLFFSLGLLAVMLFMPETFKYSLTPLAIPVAFLLAARPPGQGHPFTLFALTFGALALSAAGLDLIGERLFFWLQWHSIPLLAVVFLTAACLAEALRASERSRLGRALAELFTRAKLMPLPPECLTPALKPVSLLVPLPLTRNSRLDPAEARSFLERSAAILPAGSEILVIHYGDLVSAEHPVLRQGLARVGLAGRATLTEIPSAPGGGVFSDHASALRQGFLQSQGRIIALANLDQLCDPIFFEQALALVSAGEAELVRANRRLPESVFRVPVRLLRFVYARHRLGLRFNRLVRLFWPLKTTDTHSGNLVMTRDTALSTFALQSSTGFLFDLELALAALAHGRRERDLAVTLRLENEKTLGQVLSEMVSIFFGIPVLILRYRRGCYAPLPVGTLHASAISADDWGMSPAINRGILDLAERGIVRRVALMAASEHLEAELPTLLRTPGMELGLHFNLTYGDGQPFGHQSPVRLLWRWLGDRKQLAPRARAELELQLRRLQALGVPVRYMDGHHHIHLLPGLLAELAPVLRAHGIERVRLPFDRALFLSAKFPLNLLSWLAQADARRAGLRWQACYYPRLAQFKDQGSLRAGLRARAGAEVIVHPATSDDLHLLRFGDTYTEGRVTEYRALRLLEVPLP